MPKEFIPEMEPPHPEGWVGISVYYKDQPVPAMGEPIGKTPYLTQEQIEFAQKVVAAVQKTLKDAGLIREDLEIDVFTTE